MLPKFYRISVAGEMPDFYVTATDISDALDIAQRIIDPMGVLELSIHAEPATVSVPGPSDPAEPRAFVPPF